MFIRCVTSQWFGVTSWVCSLRGLQVYYIWPLQESSTQKCKGIPSTAYLSMRSKCICSHLALTLVITPALGARKAPLVADLAMRVYLSTGDPWSVVTALTVLIFLGNNEQGEQLGWPNKVASVATKSHFLSECAFFYWLRIRLIFFA